MFALRMILILLVVSFTASVFAQQPLPLQVGTVKGATVDFLWARVPNVIVVFEGAQGNRSVVSDKEGEFEIQLLLADIASRSQSSESFIPTSAKSLISRQRELRDSTWF